MKLIFVRHGEPLYRYDILTATGHGQAEAAARRLSGEKIDMIFSSGCGRAVQTAQHTAKQKGLPITEELTFMNEIAWGTKEKFYHSAYQPWGYAARLAQSGVDLTTYDTASDPMWHGTLVETCGETVTRGFDAWLAGFGLERVEDGYRITRENNDTVALFSHGGSSTCVFAHLLNIPLIRAFGEIRVDFTAIAEFDFSGEVGTVIRPKMLLMNDHAHIERSSPLFYGH